MNFLEKLLGKSPRNEKTVKDVQDYLSQRYDLLKLELLDKSSQILSVILSMVIVVVCALAVVVLHYKDKLFVNAFIRKFSRILYPEQEDEQPAEEISPELEEKGGGNEQ